MVKENAIQSLSDGALLQSLNRVVADARRVEAEVVAHIAEVDKRRLYEGQACSSMFAYCTEVLHLSESEAYLRISVARAARRFPQIPELLAGNQLHLTAVAKLARHLTKENAGSVLSRAVHQSKRRVEELVASLAPRADAPAGIRKLPKPRASSASPSPSLPAKPLDDSELRPDGVDLHLKQLGPGRVEEKPSPPEPLAHRPRVQSLAPERYRVQFTASAELRDKLEKLEALMRTSLPKGDLADFIEVAVTEKLERLEAKRLGRSKKPRNTPYPGDKTTGRNVPAATRRVVSKRDGDQCTFVAANGRRCSETRGLEFHHDKPYARGPDHRPDNVRLVCKAHNLYLAEGEFGGDWMAPFRGGSDKVRERPPTYGLDTLSSVASSSSGKCTKTPSPRTHASSSQSFVPILPVQPGRHNERGQPDHRD